MGKCDVPCGGDGVRSKHRIKIKEMLYGGKACEDSANVKTESCNNGECGAVKYKYK